MKLDEVQDVQKEITAILNDSEGTYPGSIFQGTLRPSKTIDDVAYGYSQQNLDEYTIELRIHEGDRRATRVAGAIREKYKKVNIESTPRVTMPSTVDLKEVDSKEPPLSKPGPLQIGLSVGHVNGGAGTLGCFVEDGSNDICILSCNHVLALLGTATSMAQDGENADYIFHPGKEANNSLRAGNRVGRLRDYVELSRDDSTIDCATAEIDESWEILGNIVPRGYPGAGNVINLVPDVGMIGQYTSNKKLVAKVGKETHYTEGLFSVFNVLNKRVGSGKGAYIFNHIYEIKWLNGKKHPFTKGGDSGSLVYTKDEHHAFAIHFASDQSGRSYCCDLHRSLNGLNVHYLATGTS